MSATYFASLSLTSSLPPSPSPSTSSWRCKQKVWLIVSHLIPYYYALLCAQVWPNAWLPYPYSSVLTPATVWFSIEKNRFSWVIPELHMRLFRPQTCVCLQVFLSQWHATVRLWKIHIGPKRSTTQICFFKSFFFQIYVINCITNLFYFNILKLKMQETLLQPQRKYIIHNKLSKHQYWSSRVSTGLVVLYNISRTD